MQKNDTSHNPNSGANAGNAEDTVRIGERNFRKIKFGLVEEEVRSYVEELIKERDALLKRQEHLAALTELAEKTVMDASNLSQSIVKKSTDTAKAESDKIKLKAEQDAEQLVKTKRAEAKTIADKEAENIRAEAIRQAKLIKDEQLDGVRAEAANLAQKLQDELIASIENIKKQAIITMTAPISVPKPSTPIIPPAPAMETSKVKEPAPAPEKPAIIPWLEIEVLPPLDIEKIMGLISHLDALPEVKTTDLLPETPNPLIRVFLNKPAPLANILRALPQIEKVNELTDVLENGDKRQKIQIVLGKNPAKPAEVKKAGR